VAAVDTDTIAIPCPSCQTGLEFDERLAGKRVRCPACRKAFLAVPPETSQSEQDDFPPWLIALLCVAYLGAACLVLAFWLGLAASMAITLGTAGISLIIWKRQSSSQAVRQFSQAFAGLMRESANRFDRMRARPSSRTRKLDERDLRKGTSQEKKTVESRKGEAPFGAEVGSSQRSSASSWTMPKWMRHVATQEPRFYGPQESLCVAGVTIDSPLVYFVEDALQIPFDASLIEASLAVARTATGSIEDLPYWPNYRGCSPKQRRVYLDWLISGRRRDGISIGYVFIYFYGLERRALLDKSDTIPILRETLRLLDLYAPSSRSFAGYASSFLWAATTAASNPLEIDDGFVDDLNRSTRRWTDEGLAASLAWHYERDKPLAPGLALVIAKQDPRAPRGVVMRRHQKEFEELFVRRYVDRFGQGMKLRAATKEHVFQYRPASATLPSLFERGSCFTKRIANVRGISSQFKPLLELWTDSMEDLKAFDRAERKSGGRTMTAAMYEALPPELREDDHPDYQAWCQVIDRCASKDGWTVVPVSELASIRGISGRNRLTKAQSEQLVRSAEAMELSIEPDPRISGQSYRWDELVSVFPKESESDENLRFYHAASIFLRLGMTIAAADGEISAIEVRRITSHLREQFNLSGQDSTRLDHLAHLLQQRPPDDMRLATKLAHLPPQERGLVGEFLIGVAAADEIVTKDEVRALKKVYRLLGLDPDAVERLAAGSVRVLGQPSDVADHLVLDPARIRQVMTETARVADLLSRVMLDEDSEGEPAFPASEKDPHLPAARLQPPMISHRNGGETFGENGHRATSDAIGGSCDLPGLPARFLGFAKIALSKSAWEQSELEEIARQSDLMLSGALEAINEWSLQHCGDWLFQENGDSVTVNHSCLEAQSDC
jgi:uncharacterized tellurite resistance protein B-like protein